MKLLGCLILSMLLLLVATSCAGGHRTPTQATHFVYLLDCSASITPKALQDAVEQIKLQAQQMRRGDRITVIPITSDSDTNTQGNILRMSVPTNRQPYDQDLKKFEQNFGRDLDALHNRAKKNLFDKTDILGSTDLAVQEFAADEALIRKRLIILSDFIEEDGTFDFRTAPSLAGENSARQLATRLAKNMPKPAGVSVFLGSLQSLELDQLPKARRQAIREFWLEYFKNEKDHPVFATDGPGMSAVVTRETR